MRFAAVALGLVACSVGSTWACPLQPEDGTWLEGDGLQLAWKLVDADAMASSRHFALQVTVCPAAIALTRVDAWIPAHRHGMNYKSSLTRLGECRWRVDGMLMHMAGAWEIRFELLHNDRRQTLAQPIDLP